MRIRKVIGTVIKWAPIIYPIVQQLVKKTPKK